VRSSQNLGEYFDLSGGYLLDGTLELRRLLDNCAE
jgi:hypothetical protein